LASDASHTVTAFGAQQYFKMAYGDGTRFVIDGDGNQMWATCPPPLTSDDLCVYLRGPAMGFVLQRRGFPALHASAVSVNGKAVVLCGQTQAGKSTIAAALSLRGLSVLSEDISVLAEGDGILQVEPGYPRICLWPEAVQNLFGKPDALPKLTPTWEKCFLPLDGTDSKFEPRRRPLGTIYLLSQREAGTNAPRVEVLSSRQALLGLVQNTYMNWLLDRTQRASEFEVLSKVVLQVPVRRIVPHSDPARIAELCDLILSDSSHLIGTREPARLVPRG
jgi:hypothetical protein